MSDWKCPDCGTDKPISNCPPKTQTESAPIRVAVTIEVATTQAAINDSLENVVINALRNQEYYAIEAVTVANLGDLETEG